MLRGGFLFGGHFSDGDCYLGGVDNEVDSEVVLKHLDLFSGIGGFALAASWVWGEEHDIHSFVEIDPFCQKVLKKHWPDVSIHEDVTTYEHDGSNIFLITGGFPCQDISIANQNGVGISGERSGLWKEFKRCIGDIQPRFAIIENASAITFRGLNTVLSDLAEIGYDAEWDSVRASDIGAYHQRERVFILSYPKGFRQKRICQKQIYREWKSQVKSMRIFERFEKRSDLPTSRFLRSLNGIPNASHRIKALGNAIVPQVVVPIMQAIKDLSEANANP